MYKIIRHYANGSAKCTIKTGLTLDEAKAHCRDPETNSKTCTSAARRRYTARVGSWFDGYTECTR